MVPIAPSRIRMRSASRRRRLVSRSLRESLMDTFATLYFCDRPIADRLRLGAGRDEDGKRIPRLARADADFRIAQPRAGEHAFQLRLPKAERAIPEFRA